MIAELYRTLLELVPGRRRRELEHQAARACTCRAGALELGDVCVACEPFVTVKRGQR